MFFVCAIQTFKRFLFVALFDADVHCRVREFCKFLGGQVRILFLRPHGRRMTAGVIFSAARAMPIAGSNKRFFVVCRTYDPPDAVVLRDAA